MEKNKININLNYSDLAAACYQFEKNKVNFIDVPARCRYNNPVVFTQDPFQTTDYVFPTIFYLSCPRVVKCISKLENDGFLGELKQKTAAGINGNGAGLYSARFSNLISLYQDYIKKIVEQKYDACEGYLIKNYDVIWNNCPIDMKINTDNLSSERITGIKYEQYLKLLKSGLGGSDCNTAIKCLHALYAFLLAASSDNDIKNHVNYGEVIFFKELIDSKLTLDKEFDLIF